MPRDADGLTPQQRTFVTAYVYDGENGTRAAKSAGYAAHTAEMQASRLLSKAKVAAEVERLRTDRDAAIKAAGVAKIENRIADLNELRDALAAVKAARASNPTIAAQPGGDQGIVTLEYRTVINPKTGESTSVQVSRVDKALIDAWLAVLKQAPQDLGQWAEKTAGAITDQLPGGSRIRRIVIEDVQYGDSGGPVPALGSGPGPGDDAVSVPFRPTPHVE